jgi:hypothetical protein
MEVEDSVEAERRHMAADSAEDAPRLTVAVAADMPRPQVTAPEAEAVRAVAAVAVAVRTEADTTVIRSSIRAGKRIRRPNGRRILLLGYQTTRGFLYFKLLSREEALASNVLSGVTPKISSMVLMMERVSCWA